MASTDVQIHRLSFPLASVVALLITAVTGVWYLAQILSSLNDALDDRPTYAVHNELEGRVDDLEDWRIEHTVSHPPQSPARPE